MLPYDSGNDADLICEDFGGRNICFCPLCAKVAGQKGTSDAATQKYAHRGGREGRIFVPCKNY